ncbi:MAG: SPOR domain-containing protein [Candidatus Omnitrophica bacterium]|nr:SPOR domain-containing protein [Candidatus Omnitrophota bacterium]
MEKEQDSQLELFSQGENEYGQAKAVRPDPSFLAHIWGYEKIILIIIGLVITGVIAFSLGIEKGKRLVRTQINAVPKIQVQPKIENQEATQPVAPAESSQNAYTIQLASYQSKAAAQKEAEGLKRKGLAAVILPKGKYTVVCVGSFNDKERARPLLTELKKRYQDCFIRRL